MSESSPDSLSVPTGTISQILAWAGTNPQRRQAALTAELQGKQRVTLIRQLQP